MIARCDLCSRLGVVVVVPRLRFPVREMWPNLGSSECANGAGRTEYRGRGRIFKARVGVRLSSPGRTAYQMLATLLFRPLDFDVGGPLHAVKHVDFNGRASALWVSDVSLVHKCGVQSAFPALVLFSGSGCLHD